MARKTRRSHRVKAEMNVVPYIDVMLVLLVIFMIAAPLIQRSVEIDLPQVSEQNSSADAESNDLTLPLILTVDAEGRYYLNINAEPAAVLAQEQIEAQSRDYLVKHPNIDVYVSGDASVNYSYIVKGIDYLRAAGATQVNLSSQLPKQDNNQ